MLVHETLAATAARTPGLRLLEDTEQRASASEVAAMAGRVAHALTQAAAIAPGDRVAILLENSVAFVVAYYGALAAGSIAVPIDPKLTIRNIEWMLRDAEPSALVLHAAQLERLADVIGKIESLRVVIVTPAASAKTLGKARLLGWDAVTSGGAAAWPATTRQPQDPALILYTSGTTAEPKGVLLTHANLMAASGNIIRTAEINERDSELLTLPMTHLFGLGHVHSYVRAGGRLILRNGLLPLDRLFQTIEQEKVTSFPAVPASFAMLLERYEPLLAGAASRLRYMYTNSSPMPVDHIARVRMLLPNTRLIMYYGLTEASRSTFIEYGQVERERWNSVGPAAPGLTLTIRDDAGRALPQGKTGEVNVQGPTVSPGYWRRPQETAAALGPDGLRTGDLGRLDAEGFLTITGRVKDLINTGGFKLSPLEVEAILKEHPSVKEAAVAGVPDPAGIMGEVVAAYVVLSGAGDATPEVLRRFAMERLEPYKVPRTIRIVESLPKTEAGKIQRSRLRDLDRAAQQSQ